MNKDKFSTLQGNKKREPFYLCLKKYDCGLVALVP